MDKDKIKFQSSIIINASSKNVWNAIKDHKNWNQWTNIVHSGNGEIKTDSDITISFNSPDGVLTFERKIITYEEGKQFGWSGEAFQGLKDYHHFTVETLENGQTKFTQADGFWGAKVEGIEVMEEQTKQAYELMNADLKKYIESIFPEVI